MTPPGSFIPTEERPLELQVPLSGPEVDVTLKLLSFTLSFSPPGRAIVRRVVVRRVVRRARVVTRRRTVFVRERFTAGLALLRRFRVVVFAVAMCASGKWDGTPQRGWRKIGASHVILILWWSDP